MRLADLMMDVAMMIIFLVAVPAGLLIYFVCANYIHTRRLRRRLRRELDNDLTHITGAKQWWNQR